MTPHALCNYNLHYYLNLGFKVELWDFYNLVGFEVFFFVGWLFVFFCNLLAICNFGELHGPLGQCKRVQSQKKGLDVVSIFSILM